MRIDREFQFANVYDSIRTDRIYCQRYYVTMIDNIRQLEGEELTYEFKHRKGELWGKYKSLSDELSIELISRFRIELNEYDTSST